MRGRRGALLAGIGAAALLLGAAGARGPAAGPARPNVVLLVADDLGYGELGCQGNREIPTPNIDAIARGGVRCTQGYVSAPFCCPSRAGLLTGRYQTRFGHEFNAIGQQNRDERVGLPLSERTLAEALRGAGYATGAFGKWHLGGTPRFHPLRRGFDAFFGYLHEGHTYAPAHFPGLVHHFRRTEPPYDADNPILRGTEPVEEPEYFTRAQTREALAFLERSRQRPFFLYVPYSAVHSPMQAAPEDFDRFRKIRNVHRRVFASMLASMDDSVGAILGRLREYGLEERTLVLFLSDNGGPTQELTSGNGPLRGGKGQLWEGGIRVPFLLRWKGRLPAGKVYRQPVISLDLFATSLAAAGLPRPAGLDGVDLLPFLTGAREERPHAALFWRFGQNLALREGDWKLVRQGERGRPAAAFALYDLASDVEERVDRAAAEPEVAARLRRGLDALNAGMAPPLWGPTPPAPARQ